MRLRMISTSVVFFFAVLLYAAPQAQQNTAATKSKKMSMHMKTVTGCLQKGDEANEYSITDNGKMYGLRSSKVDLSKHVGHQVSVTGTMRPEREEHEAKGTEAKEAGNKEAGDIRVARLKMIKDSCQ